MLEWISAVIQLCNLAIVAGKTVNEVIPSALSEREKELLISAADQGIIIASEADQTGRFVYTYKENFYDLSDPARAAHYLDAFISLCDRGLVTHQRTNTFRLSGRGFDLARSFAAEASGT